MFIVIYRLISQLLSMNNLSAHTNTDRCTVGGPRNARQLFRGARDFETVAKNLALFVRKLQPQNLPHLHTSAYFSICQHTSAYVSIRQVQIVIG